MRKLPPLSALRAFEATARHLSMKRAADELSVTPTAVSHQIRRLEDALGVVLFERHVRALRLSAAGEQLYPVLNTGFDAFAQAIDAIRGTQAQPGRQRVTLTAPMGLAARWLVPRLGEFATQHPEVDLRIHASDTVVDLHGGSADLAVRYGETPATGNGFVTERLFGDAYAPVCHPGLKVQSHDDLARVPLIHPELRTAVRNLEGQFRLADVGARGRYRAHAEDGRGHRAVRRRACHVGGNGRAGRDPGKPAAGARCAGGGHARPAFCSADHSALCLLGSGAICAA